MNEIVEQQPVWVRRAMADTAYMMGIMTPQRYLKVMDALYLETARLPYRDDTERHIRSALELVHGLGEEQPEHLLAT